MTVRLWQLLAVIACATFVVGIGVGRYVVPNDPVNRTGAEFEQHLNDAFTARQGTAAARQRIEERYGVTQTTGSIAPYSVSAADLVRAAVPALEAWSADHGGYTGATLDALQRKYDAGVTGIVVVMASAATYCIQTAEAPSYYKAGPAGDILPGTC